MHEYARRFALAMAACLILQLVSSQTLGQSLTFQSDTWTTEAAMPTARSGGALAAINGKIYATNGQGSTTPDVNTLEIFDPATGGWTSGASSPNSRAYVGSATAGSTLYMIGGCIHSDCRIGTTNLVEIYDSVADSWSAAVSMPTPRSFPVVGIINGLVYVATGGPACPPCLPRSAALEVFDPATNSWSSKTPAPTPRTGATGSVVNGKLYVIGGFTNSSDVISDVVEIYDPATDSWSAGAPIPTPRYFAASAVINGLIHVIGGQDTVATIAATHEVYEPATDTWSTRVPMPVPAVGVMATTIGSQLYAGGGQLFFADGSCCNVLSSFEVYTADAAADIIPPTTTAAASPVPNAAGWNNSNVTITLSAADNSGGSGVKQIVFSSIGAQVISSTTVSTASASVTISVEGTTTLSFFAVDEAGNIEAPHSLSIKLDKTPPAFAGMPSGCSLWPPNHTLVQAAAVSATDTLSGLSTFDVNVSSSEPDGEQPEFVVSGNALQPQAVQLRTERSGSGSGRVYTITASASDLAGNTASSSAICTVPLDQAGK